jgi:3-oxoacyl-[acyl-carrier protein] reductase
MGNTIDLSNRKAVVTGGAQGIGFAVASRFVASGARVALWDRDEALARQAADALGGSDKAIVIKVEQADPASVQAATAATMAAFGRIDILDSTMPASPGRTSRSRTTPSTIGGRLSIIDLNGALLPLPVHRAAYGRRRLWPHRQCRLDRRQGGTPTRRLFRRQGRRDRADEIARQRTSGHDIAVNCITPAAAKTKIFDQMSQQHIDYMLSRIPRGRFLQVEEAAAMVAWLASAENSFTTAAVFDLSGGRATY